MPSTEKLYETVVHLIALFILACVIGALLVFIYQQWNNPEIRKIVTDNFRATIGLPIAGVFAFLVVGLFRSTEGAIKFSVIGLTFEGAAGPIIMWVFCFLAITGSIRLLWGH
jgi:hypothetical protein